MRKNLRHIVDQRDHLALRQDAAVDLDGTAPQQHQRRRIDDHISDRAHDGRDPAHI